MGTVATMRKRGIIIDTNFSFIKYLSWNISLWILQSWEYSSLTDIPPIKILSATIQLMHVSITMIHLWYNMN